MSFLDNLFKKKQSGAASGSREPFSKNDNTAFVQAMNSVAREDTPETRKALYEAMPLAWFFIPNPNTESSLKTGENISDGKTLLPLPIIQDGNGKKILPTFTDQEALGSWAGAGSHWIALQGKPLFQSVMKTDTDEIAVNPHLPDKPMTRPGGRITRLEFAALADGMIPETKLRDQSLQLRFPKQQKVLIGIPAKMPREEIFRALREAAPSHQAVHALYFCAIAFENSDPHNAVAIELAANCSQNEIENAVAAFGSSIRPWLAKNEFVDFYPCQSTPLLEAIKQKGKHIYPAKPQ